MKIIDYEVYGIERAMIKSGLEQSKKCEFCGSSNEVSLYNKEKYLCLSHRRMLYRKRQLVLHHRRTKHTYEIKDGIVYVDVRDNKGKVKNIFMIDEEDILLIINHKWSINKRVYVSNASLGSIHRLIAGAKKGDYVDHIDRNPLNNKKENLRICTNTNNIRNCGVPKNNKSGVIGVFFRKDRKVWKAYINIEYKQISLGSYRTKEEAIVARLKAEKEHFKDFAPQKNLFGKYLGEKNNEM